VGETEDSAFHLCTCVSMCDPQFNHALSDADFWSFSRSFHYCSREITVRIQLLLAFNGALMKGEDIADCKEPSVKRGGKEATRAHETGNR